MGQRGAWARRPRTPDAALATVLFVLAVGTLHMGAQGADAWGAGGIALSAGLAIALLQVHSRPWPALGAATGLFLVAQACFGLLPVFAVMVVFAVFRAACGEVNRVMIASAAVVVAVAVDTSAQLTPHDLWTNSAYLVMATAVIGSAAAGDAVRSRRGYVREVEDRARRAEDSREQAVYRRVAEDRLSIARDVHDLVAHHLAVVSVQAQVAELLIGSESPPATQAIGLVRGAAGSALADLGALIGVLRGASSAPLRPAPTLAQLPELLASFETTGLQISRSERGSAQPLLAAVDLAAYRVVQESLTNAHKHGSGQAALNVTYDRDRVVIDVANPTAEIDPPRVDPPADAPAAAERGHGIVGMRERVAAAGGTLRIEYPARLGQRGAGQFRVLATFPTDTRR